MSGTILDVLQAHSLKAPDKNACIFLSDGITPNHVVTFQQLTQLSKQIAQKLSLSLAPGDRVLLFYPNSIDYILGLLGCFYAGVIAVPLYPPGNAHHLTRLLAVAEDAEAKAILLTKAVHDQLFRFGRLPKMLANLPQIQTDVVSEAHSTLPKITADQIALLQYTSGSTGDPRGVMVTHANIIANEEMIQQGTRDTENAIFLGWLPFYHDMGLISNVLQPLFLGATALFMPPLKFMQRPVRWLQALSKYQVTTSGAPNFAYALCVQKVTAAEKHLLDVRHWKVAFCGAEPIRAETLDAFANAFSECGFQRSAFAPCYGLAEATLIVTGEHDVMGPGTLKIDKNALGHHRIIRDTADSKKIISCGKVLKSGQFKIINPDTLTECEADEVGEIWVRGPHVAEGYWNKPEATREHFRAFTANGEGPFLRTGDLGFSYQQHLYVTGRLKDMIIIRGRNYYPQDIETTSSLAHPALKNLPAAAFSIEHLGQEQLVVMQEYSKSTLNFADQSLIEKSIRDAVMSTHDICPYDILLARQGTLPKTSSGKRQRHLCREQYVIRRSSC